MNFIVSYDNQNRMMIIVNTRKIELEKGRVTVSFEDVCEYANQPRSATVTFRHGPHYKPEGFLIEGERVAVRRGMVFNATETNRA